MEEGGDTQFNSFGAAVADRLACSPFTKANRVQFPAESLLNFRLWGSCRTMPFVGGFSRGSAVSPPFHSGAAPYSPQPPLSALKTSLLKSRQNLFIHSFIHFNSSEACSCSFIFSCSPRKLDRICVLGAWMLEDAKGDLDMPVGCILTFTRKALIWQCASMRLSATLVHYDGEYASSGERVVRILTCSGKDASREAGHRLLKYSQCGVAMLALTRSSGNVALDSSLLVIKVDCLDNSGRLVSSSHRRVHETIEGGVQISRSNCIHEDIHVVYLSTTGRSADQCWDTVAQLGLALYLVFALCGRATSEWASSWNSCRQSGWVASRLEGDGDQQDGRAERVRKRQRPGRRGAHSLPQPDSTFGCRRQGALTSCDVAPSRAGVDDLVRPAWVPPPRPHSSCMPRRGRYFRRYPGITPLHVPDIRVNHRINRPIAWSTPRSHTHISLSICLGRCARFGITFTGRWRPRGRDYQGVPGSIPGGVARTLACRKRGFAFRVAPLFAVKRRSNLPTQRWSLATRLYDHRAGRGPRWLNGSLADFRMWESCLTMLVGGFSRGSPVFPRPCIPTLLHSNLISPSSALKTSMLRAAQISSLTLGVSCHAP
ncbi:hypothetical protein PR048_014142 [Dryococelus australis]|uniref:Uncharacterized protein n=1 Tax=Dryococelus australis TaxID=614101 RepID=A0ABQ9HDN6_9NEOP|nr:hypothetical protein PR048_014142 [Dryococelus australis]